MPPCHRLAGVLQQTLVTLVRLRSGNSRVPESFVATISCFVLPSLWQRGSRSRRRRSSTPMKKKKSDDGGLSFGAAGDGGERHRVDDEPVDDDDAPVGVQRSLNYQLSLLASGAAEMPGRQRTRAVFKRRGSSWAAGAPELNQSNCISKLMDPITVSVAQIWASAATRSGGQPSKGRKLEFFRAWRCAHKLHCEKCAS
jgi:hypothetical protein